MAEADESGRDVAGSLPAGPAAAGAERLEGGSEPLELADLLNTALDKGVVAHGDVTIAVADIDLVRLNLALLLSAVETAESRAGRQRESHHGAPSVAAGTTPVGGLAAHGQPPPPTRSLAGALGPALPEPAPPRSSVPRQAAGTGGGVAEAGASLAEVAPGLPARIDAAAPGVESGLARLVLTLIEVLRKVLEHQAVRRMEGGRLTDEEVERLGLALASLYDRMQDLKRVFGLSDTDLEIDLGPLGRLR